MSDVEIFNRVHLRQRRRRAQDNFAKHSFLFEWCERQILDRLSDIKKDFPVAIGLGNRVS